MCLAISHKPHGGGRGFFLRRGIHDLETADIEAGLLGGGADPRL